MAPKKRKHNVMDDEPIINPSGFSASVVKISMITLMPNIAQPWNPPKPHHFIGTGSVIDHTKGHILTCAHVADPRTEYLVQLANDSTEYPGKLLVSEADCDLAILCVDHPDFLKKAKQVKLGEFQPIGSTITVIGFPNSGNELTATTGEVAHNEIMMYVNGDAVNLASTLTAPINHGNSGGPIFDSHGNQIGVAFQAIDPDVLEAGNEMIPMPVIRQFLKNAYTAINTGTPLKGIPALPLETDSMLNPVQRARYGMKEGKHSGVRVANIDTLAKLGGLQENDIILNIDGHAIENDGTLLSFPQIAPRLDFNYLVYQKQIGDSISMKVLRDGKELNLNVPLSYRANELKLIGRKQYNRQPTYYIKNALCFQVVTDFHINMDADDNSKHDYLNYVYDLNHEHISQIPQKVPGQQLVFINTLFHASFTNGYSEIAKDQTDLDIVEAVNGIKINHITDVARAMETHKGEYHRIELRGKEPVVLHVASPEEEAEIAQMYYIKQSHSDDLKNFIDLLHSKPTLPAAPDKTLQLSTPPKVGTPSINTRSKSSFSIQ